MARLGVNVARVDQMVAEKLKPESKAIAAEGRKRIEVAPDFAYGRAFGPAPASRRDCPPSTG